MSTKKTKAGKPPRSWLSGRKWDSPRAVTCAFLGPQGQVRKPGGCAKGAWELQKRKGHLEETRSRGTSAGGRRTTEGVTCRLSSQLGGLSHAGGSDHPFHGQSLEIRVSFRRGTPPPVPGAADICRGHRALGQHASATRRLKE